MRLLTIYTLLGLCFLVGCQSVPFDQRFAEPIENAHGKAVWDAQQAVAADIVIQLGGKPVFEGTMVFEPPVGRVRMTLRNGTTMVFDGKEAWISPADAKVMFGARFHLLTWPYFCALPMKLRDPNTHLESMGKMKFGHRSYPTARLTFDAGVGDSPDDWYLVYVDDDDMVKSLAYIITFGGKDQAEAEKELHAIVYGKYIDVEGVKIARVWTFYKWNQTDGIVGDAIGHAMLGNIRFIDPAPGTFTKPAGAKLAPLPTSP